jgi:hypothetical protein
MTPNNVKVPTAESEGNEGLFSDVEPAGKLKIKQLSGYSGYCQDNLFWN